MSFFKELKEDIAQSVNELAESLDDNLALGDEPDAGTSLNEQAVPDEVPVAADPLPEAELPVNETDTEASEKISVAKDSEKEKEASPAEETVRKESASETEKSKEDRTVADKETKTREMPEEGEIVSEEVKEEVLEETKAVPEEPVQEPEEETQEVTVITKGTTINGGIKSDTSLVVKGTIEGDVECQGKLTITGRVAGNTIASEIYVNTPKLEGDINSRGIVKIDVGTVVIGNISCTSVLVSGAVKGNIEVNGPVIVDSTAVVKGDIQAKSIQINSGAVIDGHCSLAFADVDLDSFFE